MHASRELLEEINAPPKRWSIPRLTEVWDHRELTYFLGWRDVAVRYKQTVVGVAWVILQPLLLAVIFSVFLGLLTRSIPSNGVRYPLFALAGMTMWLFFASAMGKCAESTVTNTELISKVYFPRLVIPLAALIQPAFDFVVSFGVLVLVMLVYGVVPGPRILLMPLVFLLACVVAAGIGLWLSALVVRYRDVKHVIPFLIQTLVFITPVLYPLSLVPEKAQALYALNPLVAVLEAWRWVLFPGSPSPGLLLLVSGATGAALVVGGLFYFQRAEASFADVI
jgi:homopolymeric O-antigen transport system permease protein